MLRHADPDRDAAACAAIYAASVAGDAYASFEEEPPGAAEMARRIAASTASHAWLVDERDGAVAGYAYATPHKPRAAYRWACETSVYVDAAHAGRGVGRGLYSALLELLRRQGMRVAVGGIALPNAASVALHESFGFRLVGVYRGIGYKAGAWRDVGWWQVDLAPPGDGLPAEPRGPQRLA